MKFIYQPKPVKILFGSSLPEAIERELDKSKPAKKIWIIASERHNKLVQKLSEIKFLEVAEHFSRVLQHVPADQVQKARHHVAKREPDILLAIGGGSAIGLAKAVALKHSVRIWAAPTTYSGSEMTDIYGITGIASTEQKQVGRDIRVLPERAFYDPGLTLTMPVKLAAQSALNALAHLVEAVYSQQNNPFTYESALHGIRVIFSGINRLMHQADLQAGINESLLLGSSIAGRSLAEVDMALQHKASHVLAGSFRLDHAATHSVLLPYTLNLQWSSLSRGMQTDLQNSLNMQNPAKGIIGILQRLDIPSTLRELGFEKSFSGEAARQILDLTFQNPAPLDEKILKTLVEDAFDGELRNW